MESVHNYDLDNIHRPINVPRLAEMLEASRYDKQESRYLLQGFLEGFDLEYSGSQLRRDTARNLPFKEGVGDEDELWGKMLKEVNLKRFAVPYSDIPFEHYIQSPVGLVPKANGQTRLIFHLSYDFPNGNKLVNSLIPHEACTVHYRDLDYAVKQCLKLLKVNPGTKLWFGVSDLKSAFRLIPLKRGCWFLLIMKARNPRTGQWAYFMDKCLPFGASISCKIFQRFSNALEHITQYKLEHIPQRAITNYLDDFLKISISESLCNEMLKTFHEVCDYLAVPLAKEKTVWAALRLVFLGILMDGESWILALPEEKRLHACNLLQWFIGKKKAMVHQVQSLAGLLNFLNRAIVPGRVFTRRLYAKVQTKTLKLQSYHHVNLDMEFRQDCKVWLHFLRDAHRMQSYCHPFTDQSVVSEATEVGFYTDSSANEKLGFGGICGPADWFFGQWEPNYIARLKPSIEYLELYAVAVGLFIFADCFRNCKLLIHCDNNSVVQMINATSSSCEHCMHLLRMIVLKGLYYNFRVVAKHVGTRANGLADSLSRLQWSRFHKLTKGKRNRFPRDLPPELWPASKIWNGVPELGRIY